MSRINDIKYLKAYYKLNGETDSSGYHVDRINGNNLTNPTGSFSYRENTIGKICTVFDASDGADALQGEVAMDPNDITISAKITADSLIGGDRTIISRLRSSGSQEAIDFGVKNSTNFLFVKVNNNSYNLTDDTTALSLDEEYNVAMTYNGTTWKLFLNGSLIASEDNAISVTNDDDTWLIGTDVGASTSSAWTGSISEVRIYNTALTNNEISELHASMNIAEHSSKDVRSVLGACVKTTSEWIDTGIQLSSQNVRIQMDLVCDDNFSGTSGDVYVGGYYAGNNTRAYIRKNGTAFQSIYDGLNFGAGTKPWTTGRRIRIETGPNGFFTDNNRTVGNYYTNLITSTNTIKFFRINGNSAKFWLINCRILIDEAIVFDGYPNEAGELYDTVSGSTFLTNTGDTMDVRKIDTFSDGHNEQVLYHAKDGNYIDTGHIPTVDTTWEVDCRFLLSNSSYTPIGCYDTSNSSSYGHFSMGTRTDGVIYCGYSNGVARFVGSGLGDFGRHVWKLAGGDGLYVDNEKIFDLSSINDFVTGDKTIHVNNTVSDTDKPGIEIYRSTIWEDGVLVQNLLPDGLGGMYDTVTGDTFNSTSASSTYVLNRDKYGKQIDMRGTPYDVYNGPVIGGSCYDFQAANAHLDYGDSDEVAMVEMEINPTSVSNVPLFRNSAGSVSVQVTSGLLTATGRDAFFFVNGVEDGTVYPNRWNHVVVYFKRVTTFNTMKLGRNASIGFGFCCKRFNCFDAIVNKTEAESFAKIHHETVRKGW